MVLVELPKEEIKRLATSWLIKFRFDHSSILVALALLRGGAAICMHVLMCSLHWSSRARSPLQPQVVRHAMATVLIHWLSFVSRQPGSLLRAGPALGNIMRRRTMASYPWTRGSSIYKSDPSPTDSGQTSIISFTAYTLYAELQIV